MHSGTLAINTHAAHTWLHYGGLAASNERSAQSELDKARFLLRMNAFPPACMAGARPIIKFEQTSMEHIRIKISVHLNQNHALTEKDLESFRPAIERGIAGSLPGSINIDTVKVTKIKEVASASIED